MQYIATRCNMLQHIATRSNTLQHTTTNNPKHTTRVVVSHAMTYYITLQHTATQRNTLQHTATHNPERTASAKDLYGVATISRHLKMIGLFCNTAL